MPQLTKLQEQSKLLERALLLLERAKVQNDRKSRSERRGFSDAITRIDSELTPGVIARVKAGRPGPLLQDLWPTSTPSGRGWAGKRSARDHARAQTLAVQFELAARTTATWFRHKNHGLPEDLDDADVFLIAKDSPNEEMQTLVATADAVKAEALAHLTEFNFVGAPQPAPATPDLN